MNIFDRLNVPEKRRTPEYLRLLEYGDEEGELRYGPGFYQENELWLQEAEAANPAASALAEWMAQEEYED